MERRVDRNLFKGGCNGSWFMVDIERSTFEDYWRKLSRNSVARMDSYHGRDRAARCVIKIAGCTARLHAGGLSRHSPINGERADKEDKLDRDAVAGTKGPRGDKAGGT